MSDTSSTSTSSSAAYDLVWVDQLLGRPEHVAQILTKLLLTAESGNNEDSTLLALQLCFDLMDSGDQAFVNLVAKSLASSAVVPEEGSTTADNNNNSSSPMHKALRILTGGFSAELSLSFMHKQNKADRLIMENLKKALEERTSGSRSSVLHTAAVVTHSYLYAGTTNDSFLRDYLDWMKKASNWYV